MSIIKIIFLSSLFILSLEAKIINLEFQKLNLQDKSSQELVNSKIRGVDDTQALFFKINDNIYLYYNCNAPRFSGINILNIKNKTNEDFAHSDCSLAKSETLMFDINEFSETFTIVTSYKEESYFRVTENKCDFDGKCKGKYLLVYRMGENEKPTLCKQKENDIFSCASNKKVISICETKNDNKEENILTYRFGKLNTKPELEYSSKKGKMAESFSYASDGYMNGNTKELSFGIGKYRYTVSQDIHNYKDNSAGLTVEKNNKKIKYFPCNKATPKNSWQFDFKLKEHKTRGIGEGTERL